jgi:hypothetical protein
MFRPPVIIGLHLPFPICLHQLAWETSVNGNNSVFHAVSGLYLKCWVYILHHPVSFLQKSLRTYLLPLGLFFPYRGNLSRQSFKNQKSCPLRFVYLSLKLIFVFLGSHFKNR